MEIVETDVLIIGGGIAGLTAADYLSLDKNVIVITKSDLEHSNSYLAQGGVSAAIDKEDSWQDHFFDTLNAGHFHNDYQMTELLVKEGQNVINILSAWGVPLDKNERNTFQLGKEGGHNKNRIVHAGGDQTGKTIMKVLSNRIKDKANIVSGEYAIDLIVDQNTCFGAFCKDNNGNLTMYKAFHTILAGGGYAGIYSVSSNCYGSDGSSISMAYRAGVELADLEFVQFHPTLLKNDYGNGLITEAIRGQGGILVNSKGIPIMDGVHPQKDLAPRDIVSRRLFEEIHSHRENVYLDIRTILQFSRKFPGVTLLCESAGVSLENGLIPVAPGAHFTMGGIKTDLDGRTSMKGLYAIGECANTGVHGANRLASNSLLEGVVFAKQAASHIIQSERNHLQTSPTFKMDSFLSSNKAEQEVLAEKVIQSLMDECAGICRHREPLIKAKNLLQMDDFRPYLLTWPLDLIKRLNMQTMGWLTVTSCLKREESRGSHYRTDFPSSHPSWQQKKIVRSIRNDKSIIAKKAAAGIFN
ncbi:L-aspartate oxidase [Fictibacillus nanhaiensis]|uniref:L-aspartate oxidase n=1 Tax=Fictibacillus nanhaiensis TaxID=742169 RepID=UPI001C98677C|nr:L-aspartate oxidase [Fictibacillus nanhaiensis]MBY6035330.1 L-aspartate oxidase [Fictibacillus nanhaiensis]